MTQAEVYAHLANGLLEHGWWDVVALPPPVQRRFLRAAVLLLRRAGYTTEQIAVRVSGATDWKYINGKWILEID